MGPICLRRPDLYYCWSPRVSSVPTLAISILISILTGANGTVCCYPAISWGLTPSSKDAHSPWRCQFSSEPLRQFFLCWEHSQLLFISFVTLMYFLHILTQCARNPLKKRRLFTSSSCPLCPGQCLAPARQSISVCCVPLMEVTAGVNICLCLWTEVIKWTGKEPPGWKAKERPKVEHWERRESMHGCYQNWLSQKDSSLYSVSCTQTRQVFTLRGPASATCFGSVQERQVKQDSKDPLPLPTCKNG